jgi:hypothetical protein
MSSVVWDNDVFYRRRNSDWSKSFKEEMREKERRYREIIRESLEKHNTDYKLTRR